MIFSHGYVSGKLHFSKPSYKKSEEVKDSFETYKAKLTNGSEYDRNDKEQFGGCILVKCIASQSCVETINYFIFCSSLKDCVES